jgi:hypothetical protein
MSYSIGCIGNTNQKNQVFSSTVIIDGKACFTLSNGIKAFENGKPGLFISDCERLALLNSPLFSTRMISIQAYPNPVISGVTIRSIEPLKITDNVYVAIFSAGGRKMWGIVTRPNHLYEGIKANMGGWGKGVYFIKVLSKKIYAEFKLIKID